jgi:cytochrome P450 family 144
MADFDPFAPETIECPYGLYDEIRRECPVHRSPRGGHFVVSRHADLRAAVMNAAQFSSELVAVPTPDGIADLGTLQGRGSEGLPPAVLAIADPPVHTRHRKLLTRVFSAHEVARFEPKIRSLANELVDAFAARGHAELMSEFAVPLPMTIIADVLGFPRADLARLKGWSDAGVKMLSGVNDFAELLEAGKHALELESYLLQRLEEKAAVPADDVTSLLVTAGERGDPPLSRAEMAALLLQLLIAGNESTTSLIGNAVYLLLRNSQLLERVRADRATIPALLEETLRLESPFQGHFRRATADVDLGGSQIPAGSVVMLLWGSANRDPDAFPGPDRIDLDRHNLKDHVAFGEGIHYCLGAALARLEGRIAIDTLLDRLAELRLADGRDLPHEKSFFIRRLRELPVRFGAGLSRRT